jgi:hypothetical protein
MTTLELHETRDTLLAALDAFIAARQHEAPGPLPPLIDLTPPEFIDLLKVLIDAQETVGFISEEGQRIWSVTRLLLHKLKVETVTEVVSDV